MVPQGRHSFRLAQVRLFYSFRLFFLVVIGSLWIARDSSVSFALLHPILQKVSRLRRSM